jgi:hypothetical protein
MCQVGVLKMRVDAYVKRRKRESTKVYDGGSTGVQKMEIHVLDDRWVIKERVGREKRSFSDRIAIKESIDQYSSGMRYAKRKTQLPNPIQIQHHSRMKNEEYNKNK